MGCTASRPEFEDQFPKLQQEWHHTGKGISIHPHNPNLLHDFNIVSPSSSPYCIDTKLGQSSAEQSKTRAVFGGTLDDQNSMTEMLQLLESLDMGNASVQSNQVSSILEDLKPGLERHFSQALGKSFHGGGGASPALPIAGKENARPMASSPSRDAISSPISSQKGSASPTVKTLKSKLSFASRLLKRSSSFLGSQKQHRNGSKDGINDEESASMQRGLQSAKGKDGSMLFDPDFLNSYESALKELTPEDWDALKDGQNQRHHEDQEVEKQEDVQELRQPVPIKPQPVKKRVDPLEKFEQLCPPSGENNVVLYTTSLRGIRKTFEDCNSLRSVLESFQVNVDERDVAMHQGFRNELREMMGNKPVPVPRLFIKGRYIGGAEDVLQLHEEGQLVLLLEGLPRDQRGATHPCDGCGGARFVPCLECSGSRKVVDPDNPKDVIRCSDCNENGLIQCPICS